MVTQIVYVSTDYLALNATSDPYGRPSFSFANRFKRWVWNLIWLLLYRPSPRLLHPWRALLLRTFGATIGPHCRFYPSSKVWAPWNLTCEDLVVLADGVEVYNQAPIHLGSHAIVSQYAYLCGSTHDFNDPAFPLIAYRTEIGPYAWICAKATLGPGVQVGAGAVLGLASVAIRDLEPWGVYAGVPAVKVKERNQVN